MHLQMHKKSIEHASTIFLPRPSAVMQFLRPTLVRIIFLFCFSLEPCSVHIHFSATSDIIPQYRTWIRCSLAAANIKKLFAKSLLFHTIIIPSYAFILSVFINAVLHQIMQKILSLENAESFATITNSFREILLPLSMLLTHWNSFPLITKTMAKEFSVSSFKLIPCKRLFRERTK